MTPAKPSGRGCDAKRARRCEQRAWEKFMLLTDMARSAKRWGNAEEAGSYEARAERYRVRHARIRSILRSQDRGTVSADTMEARWRPALEKAGLLKPTPEKP